MNKNSDSIEYLINFAEKYGVDGFIINNAKAELDKLKNTHKLYDIVGWARINDRGDLYDPRFCYNPYVAESVLIPLYANRKEFYERFGKSS